MGYKATSTNVPAAAPARREEINCDDIVMQFADTLLVSSNRGVSLTVQKPKMWFDLSFGGNLAVQGKWSWLGTRYLSQFCHSHVAYRIMAVPRGLRD